MTMRIDTQGKLFFGVKVDSKMREQLGNASSGSRSFFEGPRATLVLCAAGADTYLGKIVDAGLSSDEIDDMVRHVHSVLDRIAPERSRRNALKVFVAMESGLPQPTLTPPTPETSGEDDFR
ncbi:MAG TPA: hypothetical protein VGQ83_42930 [Polyangia bacterium]